MRFKLIYFNLIGILIFVWLLSRIEVPKLFSILKETNVLFLVIAFLVSFLAMIGNFLRWHYLLTCLGVFISKKEAIKLSLQSLFAEQTPGKLGEPVIKAIYLNKNAQTSLPNSLFSTFFHKFIDIWAAVIESIFVIIFLFIIFKINLSIVIPSIIFFSLIIFVLFILVYNRRFSVLIFRPFFNLFVPIKYKDKLRINLVEFYENFKKINKRVLFVSLIYDLIVVLLTAISLYFITLAIGQSIPFIHLIMVVPLLSIAVGLPISVAGIGAREITFVFYFSLLGINSEIGVLFGILLLLFKILSMVPGLILSFIKK